MSPDDVNESIGERIADEVWEINVRCRNNNMKEYIYMDFDIELDTDFAAPNSPDELSAMIEERFEGAEKDAAYTASIWTWNLAVNMTINMLKGGNSNEPTLH